MGLKEIGSIYQLMINVTPQLNRVGLRIKFGRDKLFCPIIAFGNIGVDHVVIQLVPPGCLSWNAGLAFAPFYMLKCMLSMIMMPLVRCLIWFCCLNSNASSNSWSLALCQVLKQTASTKVLGYITNLNKSFLCELFDFAGWRISEDCYRI